MAAGSLFDLLLTTVSCVDVEPMTGIEPAYSAWEVDSSRLRASVSVRQGMTDKCRIPPLACGNRPQKRLRVHQSL